MMAVESGIRRISKNVAIFKNVAWRALATLGMMDLLSGTTRFHEAKNTFI